MISTTRYFIGREFELRKFRRALAKPYDKVRILLILGSGGIGKTKLIERMLVEVKYSGVLAPEYPLDLSATEYRSIDGIQWKIIEMVEALTGLKDSRSPFAEFQKENQDTSEQFNRCLRAFCAQTPLVLAFDTFETLDTVSSNWLLAEGNEGLQVPGLICIVAGRPRQDIDILIEKKTIKRIMLSGLSLSEIEEFYRKYSNDVGRNDILDFLLDYADVVPLDNKRIIERIYRLTQGHPLRVEMAFNWANMLGDINSEGITTPQTFEKKMMEYICEQGDKGDLNVGSMKASHAVFDALACMGYVTRRFDEGILKYLISAGHIRSSKKSSHKDILEPLEKYFFVKTRIGDQGEQFYQLHDEMARLVREYVWYYRDPLGRQRKALLEDVLRFYDQMIVATKDEGLKRDLRIERLYYTFKLDQFYQPLGEDGKRLWFELAELDDDYINSYLPAEIKEYKDQYKPQTRYEIHARIAQIEYEANHITQAKGEWEQVLRLGQKERRNDWIASAMFNLANCEKDASLALKKYKAAKRFCEKYARDYLPRVNYNIGLSYRRMQNVEQAIEWYKKALHEFARNPKDEALGAQIANDLGYAYSHVGKWEESRKNIKEGQKTRKDIKLRLEREVGELGSRLRATRSKKERKRLQDALARKKNQLSKAEFRLGLSHNTLGEIYRYEEDLDASLRNYDIAHDLFEDGKYYRWQAKALFSRGETHRRMAWARYRDGDEAGYEGHIAKAEADIQESLYLCEKYRIKGERDTANRRMGRVLHDRALHALERKNLKEARILLERAWERFTEGLRYANETGDDLEILSNQTELAFLYDDFVRAMGQGSVPQKYRDAMKDLKRVLDKQRKKPYRIYQFEVFENEYKLEDAAIAYQEGKYSMALKKYLEGYVGLVSDPGYGRTRYKSLFPHLIGQIEKLPRVEAAKWCRAFIEAWQTPRGVGKRKVRLEREAISPDMVEWCWGFLEKNTGV